MESAERKRSRKSRSFKLVKQEDLEGEHFDGAENTDGGSKGVRVTEAWSGDDGMEIKRQITGMMRLLGDKARRGGALTSGPQDTESSGQRPSAVSQEKARHGAWSQHGTRSRMTRVLKDRTSPAKLSASVPSSGPGSPGPVCCMCNCKSTLQAILEELRAMRALMQRQKADQEKQHKSAGTISPLCCYVPRRRPCRRRPGHWGASVASPCKRGPFPFDTMANSCTRRDRDFGESSVFTQSDQRFKSGPPHWSTSAPTADSNLDQSSGSRDLASSEPDVQLAEDFDVFMSKPQLDSILASYTRSGSLLFRKLVCAFFDDATLANSLPNGKRKRGLNDNRKGLDQNIVGAIKVFTEKYCTAHKIEKLPGPRDWVQILQDQIKLARKRLKRRSTAEAADDPATKSSTCLAGSS